jgi:hypothetical protein
MTNVEVSTAISIGIKNARVMIDTKKTPPPIPAIVETIPDNRPNKIRRDMTETEISIFNKIRNPRKRFSKN